MLRCSDLVHKGTKANETLTGGWVPVSAIQVESTGMVMAMQNITTMQLVYFKTERCLVGPGRELYGRAHLAGGVLMFSVTREAKGL